MHVYDSYHSRWFIWYSVFSIGLAIRGYFFQPEMAVRSTTVLLIFTPMLMIMITGTVLSGTRGLWFYIPGFVLAGAAWILPSGYMPAGIMTAGFLLFGVPALYHQRAREPETGAVWQEWVGTSLLCSSLFVQDTAMRRILLIILSLRFLFGLIFRIVPIRVSWEPWRSVLRGFSWLPGIIVFSGMPFSENLNGSWRLFLWIFLFYRLSVLIDEARIRLLLLSDIVPRGERRGLWKSYVIYYLVPFRGIIMKRFYRSLVPRDGSAWDVGAHLGNRTCIWLDLGARVVAFEPQPTCSALLNNWFGSCPGFSLERVAVGAEKGRAVLNLPEKNPTLASVSIDWISRMAEKPLFAGINWNKTIDVPMISLAEFRRDMPNPDFLKIDVEGFESQVVKGLGEPAPGCLSFELLPSDRANALKSIEILCRQGEWQWNISIKEQFRFLWPQAVKHEVLAAWIENLEDTDPSGDIYAFRLDDC